MAVSQLLGRAFLQNIAAGADVDAFGQVVLVVVHGEEHDPGLGTFLANLAGGLEAAHAGHPDIHQNHIGMSVCATGNGIGGVGRFARDLDIGFRREQRSDSLPEQGVIVSQEYANFCHFVSLVRSLAAIGA